MTVTVGAPLNSEMSLKVKVVERWPGAVNVTLSGRLDGQTVGDCQATLKAEISGHTRFLTFDLDGLDYISSMGIRLLLQYRKLIEGREGKMVMANLQPQIAKVIDIANVLPTWGIFASIEEADAYFDKMQGEAS